MPKLQLIHVEMFKLINLQTIMEFAYFSITVFYRFEYLYVEAGRFD